MELTELGVWQLTYRTLDVLDFGVGGQIYGTLDGSVSGPGLTGDLELTNIARRRPDNVNMPTLRGLLRTGDGASVWVELDGIAVLRPEDGARTFITSVHFRTGDERYARLNPVPALLEGVLDPVAGGGRVHGRLYECRHTLA